jgi:7,8-dihydroneopterin aldolase/epimerase/oxygenase
VIGKRNSRSRLDIVYLHGLRVDAVIGVYEWEQHVRQTLVIDLDMACDTHAAAVSDQLNDALDYAAVANRVREVVRANRRQLLESLAESLAGMIMQEFAVPWLRLKLAKPGAVADCGDTGIVIERGERNTNSNSG